MNDKEVREYLKFMYDSKNVHNCEKCPNNAEYDSGASGNRLPCGQYNCWVKIHCNSERR